MMVRASCWTASTRRCCPKVRRTHTCTPPHPNIAPTFLPPPLLIAPETDDALLLLLRNMPDHAETATMAERWFAFVASVHEAHDAPVPRSPPMSAGLARPGSFRTPSSGRRHSFLSLSTTEPSSASGAAAATAGSAAAAFASRRGGPRPSMFGDDDQDHDDQGGDGGRRDDDHHHAGRAHCWACEFLRQPGTTDGWGSSAGFATIITKHGQAFARRCHFHHNRLAGTEAEWEHAPAEWRAAAAWLILQATAERRNIRKAKIGITTVRKCTSAAKLRTKVYAAVLAANGEEGWGG